MTLSRLVLGLLASAALALSAQDFKLSAQDLKYGVQATVGMPLGDLKDAVDSKPGIGVGAHLTADFGQGHLLRPRVDYLVYPDATVFGTTIKVNRLSLGADYLYVFEGKSGPYVLGGLAVNRWKVDSDTPAGSVSNTSTKLGYALGGGFAFNEQFSVELRYTASRFGRDSETANAFEVAAYYRF